MLLYNVCIPVIVRIEETDIPFYIYILVFGNSILISMLIKNTADYTPWRAG